MRKDIQEANVVLSKCYKTHKTFGIRIERRLDNVWYCTWAFPISEKSALREGYGNKMISGRVVFDPEYPGCPYCSGQGWVRCYNCGKLTCWDDIRQSFTCSWCGSSGEVSEADTFDLQAGEY